MESVLVRIKKDCSTCKYSSCSLKCDPCKYCTSANDCWELHPKLDPDVDDESLNWSVDCE